MYCLYNGVSITYRWDDQGGAFLLRFVPETPILHPHFPIHLQDSGQGLVIFWELICYQIAHEFQVQCDVS